METKKIEIINYKNVYIAADGTEFDDQEQCEIYEKSASGVLFGRLAKMAVNQMSECTLYDGSGSDDNTSYVVIPRTEAEVTSIQQLVHMKTYGKEWKEKYAARVAIGKALVVTVGYDQDSVWVQDLGEIVSEATNGKFKVVEVE